MGAPCRRATQPTYHDPTNIQWIRIRLSDKIKQKGGPAGSPSLPWWDSREMFRFPQQIWWRSFSRVSQFHKWRKYVQIWIYYFHAEDAQNVTRFSSMYLLLVLYLGAYFQNMLQSSNFPSTQLRPIWNAAASRQLLRSAPPLVIFILKNNLKIKITIMDCLNPLWQSLLILMRYFKRYPLIVQFIHILLYCFPQKIFS
jgi:hypothetical protein